MNNLENVSKNKSIKNDNNLKTQKIKENNYSELKEKSEDNKIKINKIICVFCRNTYK